MIPSSPLAKVLAVLALAGAAGAVGLVADRAAEPPARVSTHTLVAPSRTIVETPRVALAAPARGEAPQHNRGAVPGLPGPVAQAPLRAPTPVAPPPSTLPSPTPSKQPLPLPVPHASSSVPVRDNAETDEEATLNRERATRVLAELQAPGAEQRLAAVKTARDYSVPGVTSALQRAALEDKDDLVRRFATQALALDEQAGESREVFEKLLNATDAGVRLNALIGLARGGDELARRDLQAHLERLRAERSPRAAAIERALAR